VPCAAFEPYFFSHMLEQLGMHVMHLVEGRHFEMGGGACAACTSACTVRSPSIGRGCRGEMNGVACAACRLS
jgi:hypothetical protein